MDFRSDTSYEQTLVGVTFAEVFLCSDRVTGVVYAAKVMTVEKWERSTYLNIMRNEVRALRELQKHHHSNIVRLTDLFAEYSENKISMVLELITGGELFNYIVMKQKLTEVESRKIFTQIFSAVEFLVAPFSSCSKLVIPKLTPSQHEQGWVHRDIKPREHFDIG